MENSLPKLYKIKKYTSFHENCQRHNYNPNLILEDNLKDLEVYFKKKISMKFFFKISK